MKLLAISAIRCLCQHEKAGKGFGCHLVLEQPGEGKRQSHRLGRRLHHKQRRASPAIVTKSFLAEQMPAFLVLELIVAAENSACCRKSYVGNILKVFDLKKLLQLTAVPNWQHSFTKQDEIKPTMSAQCLPSNRSGRLLVKSNQGMDEKVRHSTNARGRNFNAPESLDMCSSVAAPNLVSKL